MALRKLLQILSIIIFLSTGFSSAHAIIGGVEVDFSNPIEKHVLLLTAKKRQQIDINNSNPQQGFVMSPYCSAVALSSRIILTAAHCLNEKIIFVSRASEAELTRKIIHFVVPQDWPLNSNSDIALAVLDLELPQDTQFAVLDDEILAAPLKNKMVQPAGFGQTSGRLDLKHDEGTLRTTEVRVLGPNRQGSIVIVDQYAGSGICHGDSGGPFYLKDEGLLKLVGISQSVAAAPGASELEYNTCSGIGKFTSVFYFKDWIQKTHQQLLQHYNQQPNL